MNIKRFRQKIVRERSSNNFPMILVGNKSDLESQRKVTKQ
jgi:GTPase SAR1 family protein